jgi:CRP-like cAMP-binding protein
MIYWDLLLKTDDPGPALQSLYDGCPSVIALAEYLGVSKNGLMQAFKTYGIKLRARGGPHPSFRKDLIPKNAVQLTAKELAERTGYSKRYCEKILARLRQEEKHEEV